MWVRREIVSLTEEPLLRYARDSNVLPPMRMALDENEFFSAPTGRYLLAPGLAFWCFDPSLWGATFSGAMELAHAERMIGWIEAEFRRDFPPYDTLLDFSSLTRVDEATFARFGGWYLSTRERQATRVRRAAVVGPSSGLIASAVAGFAHVLGPMIPWSVLPDLEAAARWLDLHDRASLCTELTSLRTLAAAPTSPLDAVRGVLDGATGEITAEHVASRLGLSLRTLQRQLQAAGTGFEQERMAARIRRAQRLLTETDDKLGAIALASGFATQAHFNAVFRRMVGESPGEWRARATRTLQPPR